MPKKKPGKGPKPARPPVPPSIGDETGHYGHHLTPFGAPPGDPYPRHMAGPGYHEHGRHGSLPRHRPAHHRPPHHRHGGHPGYATSGNGGNSDQLSYRVHNCLAPFASVEQATFCARIPMYDMPPEAYGKTQLAVTALETAIKIAGPDIVDQLRDVDMTWVTHGYGPAPFSTPIQTSFAEVGQSWDSAHWLGLLALGPHHQRLISLLMLLSQDLMSRVNALTVIPESGELDGLSDPETENG